LTAPRAKPRTALKALAPDADMTPWTGEPSAYYTDDRLDYPVEREASESGTLGRLNPQFVEWLMGWPIGWTELQPLAMDRFQQWLREHSAISRT